MSFEGSHLWQIRQKWGPQKLLYPGIAAFIRNERNEVLFGRRSDNGLWGHIGGYLELNEGAEEAMRREVQQETGLLPIAWKMVGVMTSPERCSIRYPNGDEVQAPSYIYDVKVEGDLSMPPVGGDDIKLEWDWFPVDVPPMRLMDYSLHVLALYRTWLRTREFQVG